MKWNKTTELPSLYRHLENMSTYDLVKNMNNEDHKVAEAVQSKLKDLVPLIDCIVEKMKNGGRLFYIGAGTSGRLGILDASECPPTFGVSHDMVIGLIAGGDSAIRKAVENAEDDIHQAWKDLSTHFISDNDVVIGIAASGTTPYVVNGLKDCQNNKIATACITCNAGAPISAHADFPIEVVVGPEFVTGSTRMKAGTAQKLILNMISTSVMIRLGRVKDNKMVDMQLSNNKLIERGIKMVQSALNIDRILAKDLLIEYQSVRAAIENFKRNQ